MAIYDAFIFNDEIEMLYARLVEHDTFVDKFILVQSDRTFSGKSKPLSFPVSDPRFARFASRIIVVNCELKENPESTWENENLQRDAIFKAVPYLPEDILFLADVDEIISRQHWKYLLSLMEKEDLIAVWLRFFYYFLNLEAPQKWVLPKLMRARVFLNNQISSFELRTTNRSVPTPFPCGWHFSFLGTPEKIQAKIASYSHQEWNSKKYNTIAKIKSAIAGRKDLFGWELKFRVVKFDDSWPLDTQTNPYWKPYVCPAPTVLTVGLDKLAWKWRQVKQRAVYELRQKLDIFWSRGQEKKSEVFSSEHFRKMIDAQPKDQDKETWQTNVAFLTEIVPKLEGWFSINQCAELFTSIARSCPAGGTIVEIGSWKGRSSVVCSRAARLKDARLFCVDTWAGNLSEGENHPTVLEANHTDVFGQFKKNMALFGCPNFTILRGESQKIGAAWQGGPIDFLFIDASHDYDAVLKDLQTWVPHVRPGGIVCGDDWNKADRPDLQGSVRKAFTDYFKVFLPNLGVTDLFWSHRLN